MPDTAAAVREHQKACNRFTTKWLKGVTPLVVDGKKGRATNSRIMACKYFLGWGSNRTVKVTKQFLGLMANPHRKAKDYPQPQMRRAGMVRRGQQRARHASESVKAVLTPGATTYDGVPVAKWMVPYLKWARANGWGGRLVSGYRSPAYSDSLCRRMCGAPSCPGMCAGRASNHAGSSVGRGALDVSDYVRFAQVIRGCPLSPRIFNDLPRDRVHFSANGH